MQLTEFGGHVAVGLKNRLVLLVWDLRVSSCGQQDFEPIQTKLSLTSASLRGLLSLSCGNALLPNVSFPSSCAAANRGQVGIGESIDIHQSVSGACLACSV